MRPGGVHAQTAATRFTEAFKLVRADLLRAARPQRSARCSGTRPDGSALRRWVATIQPTTSGPNPSGAITTVREVRDRTPGVSCAMSARSRDPNSAAFAERKRIRIRVSPGEGRAVGACAACCGDAKRIRRLRSPSAYHRCASVARDIRSDPYASSGTWDLPTALRASGGGSPIGRRSRRCCRKRVEDRPAGQAVPSAPPTSGHQVRSAPNGRTETVDAAQPNGRWRADITYALAWEGWLYLRGARPWSRGVWWAGPSSRTCVRAGARGAAYGGGAAISAAGLLHHSDRGMPWSPISTRACACPAVEDAMMVDGIV